MIILRPDQDDLDRRIDASIAGGARNVLAVLPTGGGKSIIMSHRTLKKYQRGSPGVIKAHRTELVGQMSGHIANRGIPHRIIAPKAIVSQIVADHRRVYGRSFVNPDSICTVAAVDTLNARTDELKEWAKQQEWFKTDEAHHVLKHNKWGKAAAMFPNALGEGYTASPSRADGMGLGRHHDGIFDDMVIGPDMRQLIDLAALSDYQIVVPECDFEIDDNDLPASGDFTTVKMRDASRKSRIVGDVVQQYVRWAYGKRAICFATDVETAGKIAQQFLDVGIPAAAVSGETPTELRNEYIRRFREGSIWILVNVDLFDEGFDVPAVEVVIMARPTASLSKYLQMFGRALRVMFGKQYGLIIDMVSNYKRHGLPDKPHFWSLDRRDKKAKKLPDPELEDLVPCRACSRPYLRALPACNWCGAEPPLPDPASRTLQMVDGDLILLDPVRLAAMRAATALETPASVAERVAGAAGANAATFHANRSMEKWASQARLRSAIDQWAGIQRYKGRSDRESHKRFYLATGMDVLTALHKDRSTKDFDAMAAMVEGWCVL